MRVLLFPWIFFLASCTYSLNVNQTGDGTTNASDDDATSPDIHVEAQLQFPKAFNF